MKGDIKYTRFERRMKAEEENRKIQEALDRERVQKHLRVCRNTLIEYYGRENGDTLTWKIHEMSRMIGCSHEDIARFLKDQGLMVPKEYANA